jgi:hypothetical protein
MAPEFQIHPEAASSSLTSIPMVEAICAGQKHLLDQFIGID